MALFPVRSNLKWRPPYWKITAQSRRFLLRSVLTCDFRISLSVMNQSPHLNAVSGWQAYCSHEYSLISSVELGLHVTCHSATARPGPWAAHP